MRAEQLAQAFIVNARIVRRDREARNAVLLDRIDQTFGDPA